jgi:hypothetical protein
VASVAGRCRERFDFYARSGGDPRGPQGGTFFESQSCSLSLINLVKTNILIDETGHACLADFGLLAIISDDTSHESSDSLTLGGTVRWMSPELLCPEDFGLQDSRRTEHSDCYALGMVIYEVLSGQVPFSPHQNYSVVVRVLKGRRPRRPQGAERKWFANGVWEVLERCWTPKPNDRPRIGDVLQSLEEVSAFWIPLSLLVTNPPTKDSLAGNSSDSDAEGSTEESEAPSPSQSLQTFLQKGEADGEIPVPTLPDAFIAPHYEVTSNQDLGAYAKNRSKSGPLLRHRVTRTVNPPTADSPKSQATPGPSDPPTYDTRYIEPPQEGPEEVVPEPFEGPWSDPRTTMLPRLPEPRDGFHSAESFHSVESFRSAESFHSAESNLHPNRSYEPPSTSRLPNARGEGYNSNRSGRFSDGLELYHPSVSATIQGEAPVVLGDITADGEGPVMEPRNLSVVRGGSWYCDGVEANH